MVLLLSGGCSPSPPTASNDAPAVDTAADSPNKPVAEPAPEETSRAVEEPSEGLERSPEESDDSAGTEPDDESVSTSQADVVADPPRSLPDPEGFTRLSPEDQIWIDVQRKEVVVGGQVCLTRGQLEMFACPKGTKEHESVVSLNAHAFQIHAALLAIEMEPGQTVRYQPEYQPATGPTVAVDVQWENTDGQMQRTAAQQWIRQIETGEPMTYDWVFAGSGFWKDDNTGKEYYLAEGGEAICVSNFGSALLDLPIASSQDNASLMFEALTENIPPRGTPVQLVLRRKE